MIRLFEIEFQKLWQNKLSRILIIAYFVLLTSVALIATVKFEIGPIKFYLAEQGIFNFPYIWHFNTFIASYFKLFLAIIIVSMIANEYSNKTLKQNLIDGLSKKEFLLSKFSTVFFFSIISTIFIFITSLILGLIYSNYTEIGIIFSDLSFVFAYLLKHIAFFSFCFFEGLLIKRSAFALGFLIIWFLFEEVVMRFAVAIPYDMDTYNGVMQFFPLRSMYNLINEPFSRLSAVQAVANQVGEQFTYNYSLQVSEVFICLFWTLVFIGGSYKLLQRRDL